MFALRTLASAATLAIMLTGGAMQARADSGGRHSWIMRHCDHKRVDMPYEHIKDNLAYLKYELSITDSQTARWNDFAEVARSNAAAVALMDAEAKEADDYGALLRVIESRERIMTSHFDLLHKFDAAISALYAQMNVAQKSTADELIREMCPTR